MSKRTWVIVVATIIATLSTLSAIGRDRDRGTGRPEAKAFGPGPRTSSQGLYVATLEGASKLEARKMYTLRALVVDGSTGEPVTNARINVGGGMPQHHHGFPTRPRITRELGGGWYEVGGVRFNMGGWWELKLDITTPAGTDTVTFNLSI